MADDIVFDSIDYVEITPIDNIYNERFIGILFSDGTIMYDVEISSGFNSVD